MNRLRTNRFGFTLVELLVVIGIIALLAGMIALLMPNWAQRGRVNSAATQVQQWLLVAKQMAVLDKAPRGVRFLPDPNNGNLLNKLQYIRQPEDFSGGTITTNDLTNPMVLVDPTTQNPPWVQITGVNLSLFANDTSRTNSQQWLIQPGDHIQIGDSGMVRQITPIGGTNSAANIIVPDGAPYNASTIYKIQLESPFLYPVFPVTSSYKIIRSPRVMGEESLDLATDVAVDLSTNNVTYASLGEQIARQSPNAPLDIMFSPNGAVMGNWATDRLILWVRDTSFESEFEGDPSLVVIYTRTGLIDTYEIDAPSSNPYAAIK